MAEEIEVRLPGDTKRTDAEVGDAAATVLEWQSGVPAERIRVRVERGWITLDGEVAHHFERTMADDALRHLEGVKGVSNWIRVKPPEPLPEARHLRVCSEAAPRRSGLSPGWQPVDEEC